jgi:hypothetical protein
MAKNVYFTHGTFSEQRLVEDLIIESIKIYGHDVYYLPREIVNRDQIFNEDTVSVFDENYLIEVYLLNYEGFEGDGTLLTKFGIRIAEEATFVVSRRRWDDLVSSSSNLVSDERPNEGDAIYFPLTKQLFQIKFVENEIPLRQLGDLPTYQMVCELMEFSDERLETKIDEIDLIPAEVGYSLTFDLQRGGLSDVVVTNGGTGYGATTTTTVSTPGSGSVIKPAVTTAGVISDITVIEPGIGFETTSNVFISGTGNGATATIVLANNKNFEVQETVSGTSKTAKVIGILNNGELSNTNIYKSGSGYTTTPTVTISAPPSGGTQATAAATLTNGVVSGVTITDAGSGYTSAPEILISPSPAEPQGKVIRFDYSNRQIELININGTFTDNETLRGLSSGAEWVVNEFSTIQQQNDPLSDSLDIETEADSIIDWTETNPFGEYGDMGVF